MKRKSLRRLKASLYKKLLPEVDQPILARDIGDFLDKPIGKSAHGKHLANILAAYLAQKYSVAQRTSGELHILIEHHAEELADFLDQVRFKQYRFLAETLARLPRRKKKIRARPKTEAERSRRLKESKNTYEERRRKYREGLIVKEFGESQISDPYLPLPRPTGPCLDILLTGGTVRRSGDRDSLENLFDVGRHRFPKSLHPKRDGRNLTYDFDAFLECLIHLLKNRNGGQQWPPRPWDRNLVLTGIIERARRLSSKNADKLAKRLRPFLY